MSKGTYTKQIAILKSQLEGLNKIIKTYERDQVYKSIIKEIPEQTLDLFCVKGQAKFRTLYLESRCNNVNKEQALDTTIRLVTRSYGDKINLLKGVYKSLSGLNKSVV